MYSADAGRLAGASCTPITVIERWVMERVTRAADRDSVRALIVDELRRMHEGVLARYGVRPSEFAAWKARHGRAIAQG